ncbi:MAG TPA: hypothetical protein VK994_06305, partial [Bacteroidales bacterium]|nr:hypothetical protein [Bacteroidales bacterium]
MLRSLILCIIIVILCRPALTQVVFEPGTSHVYDLLDELAGEKIIEVNDVVKPWSRVYIADKLQQALDNRDKLTERQLRDIEFYLKDYRLELVFNTRDMKPLNLFPKQDHIATSLDPLSATYRDSLFAFCLRPSLGLEALFQGDKLETVSSLGLEGFGYYSDHLGIYGGYNYNYESSILTGPDFLEPGPGAVTYTYSDGSQDYHKYRWGAVFSNRWMALGLLNDRPQWGSGYYGSNILSGHAPSFTHVMLQLKPI